MQKYMERIQKGIKLKQEKIEIEQKVFNTGKNWTPQITQPNAPKLTAKRTIQAEDQEESYDARVAASARPQTKTAIPSLRKAYNLDKSQDQSA